MLRDILFVAGIVLMFLSAERFADGNTPLALMDLGSGVVLVFFTHRRAFTT